MSAPAIAAADPPPPEELLVIPTRIFLQCEDDARRIDRMEPALRSCQRDLDAQTGALGEARAQREAEQEQRRALEHRVAELDAENKARWSPITWASIGAGSVLVLILGVMVAAR